MTGMRALHRGASGGVRIVAVAALSVAACGGSVSTLGQQQGASSSGGGAAVSGSDGGSNDDSPAGCRAYVCADATTGSSIPSSGGGEVDASEDVASIVGGGGPVDAGYYYGSGSYWVEGGAYPEVSDAASEGGTGVAAIDASPGCAPLAACCATLPGGSQTLCDSVAGAGDANNCATELSQLQSEGDCMGAVVLASQVQVAPTRLVSDGTLLFWTTEGAPGLLAMPVGGGAITTLLGGPVGDFLAVDDVNVYVLEANDAGGTEASPQSVPLWNLIRIPKSGGAATLVNESGAYVLAAATRGVTAYWLESEVPVGSGWRLPLDLKSTGLQSGPASLLAQWTPSGDPPGAIGVTNTAVFFIDPMTPGLQFFPRSTGPAGGFVSAAGPTACHFLEADSDAVYCSQATGSNFRIASDGTAADLGTAVSSSYIVFDDTNAYWANKTTVGTLMKAPKAGGGTATVIARDTNPTAIAIDATSVYWSNQDGYIKSIPR